MLMVKGTLVNKMRPRPILPVKVSDTIDKMLHVKFDCDFDGHVDGDATCKQTFSTGTHTLKRCNHLHDHITNVTC